MRWLPRRFEVTGLEVALDLMPGDSRRDPIDSHHCDRVERARLFKSECRDQITRAPAQAGDQLPAVAPRRAVADALGLKQDDLAPTFGRGQRRRHPGETAADDDQVGMVFAFKRALRRKPVCGGAVIVASLVQSSHAEQQMLALP